MSLQSTSQYFRRWWTYRRMIVIFDVGSSHSCPGVAIFNHVSNRRLNLTQKNNERTFCQLFVNSFFHGLLKIFRWFIFRVNTLEKPTRRRAGLWHWSVLMVFWGFLGGFPITSHHITIFLWRLLGRFHFIHHPASLCQNQSPLLLDFQIVLSLPLPLLVRPGPGISAIVFAICFRTFVVVVVVAFVVLFIFSFHYLFCQFSGGTLAIPNCVPVSRGLLWIFFSCVKPCMTQCKIRRIKLPTSICTK